MEIIVVTGLEKIKAFANLDSLRDFVRNFVGTYEYSFKDDEEKMTAMVYGDCGERLFNINEVLDDFYEITGVDIKFHRITIQGY